MQKRLACILAFMLTGGILASCGPPVNPEPGPTPAPQPDPLTEMSALVIEEVNSPVYNELIKSVKMVPYDGSQKAADHDLVILDGDVHSAEEVAKHPLIAEALDAGTSVLLVDATGGHKREGLGKYLGFASKEDSPAYLASRSYDENNQAAVRVLEFPSTIDPVFTGLPSPAPVSVSAPGAVKAFIDRALAVIGGSAISTQQGYSPYPCSGNPNDASLQTAQSSGEVIPDGAIYKHVSYCVPVPWTTGGTYDDPNASQTPYFDTNYTFTLMLDNGNKPQGNFQYVVAEVDVNAVPNGDANSAQAILNNSDDNRGWFQDRIVMDIAPADSLVFESQSDSPETADDSATVTTNFQVNSAIAYDPNSAGQYSKTQTVSLPDWAVTNDSVGSSKVWNYRSHNPIDADNRSSGFDRVGRVLDLNDLNTNRVQFSAQAAWKTESVQTDWVDFNVNTEQHVADLRDFDYAQGYYHFSASLSLYMGAVVPVPIDAITFEDTVYVLESTQTNGTITLSAPAPEDLTLPLSSDSENVVVPPSVTINQGDTSADFDVEITSNGGGPGTTFAAIISTFYALPYSGTIIVENQPRDYIEPPTSFPLASDYAACVGTDGEWVEGYAVRYAVTYANSTGETAYGPWSNFFSGGVYALPALTDVPTDPLGHATSRNIYRQFQVDYSNDPTSGIVKIGTINDNTTRTFQDNDAAGTTFLPCPN